MTPPWLKRAALLNLLLERSVHELQDKPVYLDLLGYNIGKFSSWQQVLCYKYQYQYQY